MADALFSNDRLDSWKEIAAYLKRNERTVSRWEKRGLPVYRVPGSKKQAVFAYRHELDAWLHCGGAPNDSSLQRLTEEAGSANVEAFKIEELTIASSQQIDSPPTKESAGFDCSARNGIESGPSKQPSIPALFFPITGNMVSKKWRLVVVIVCTLGVAAAISIGLALHRPATPRIVHLEKLTVDGQAKSNLRSYGTHLYFNQFEAGREILVTSSVGDGTIRPINTPLNNVDLQDISNDGQTLLVTSFEGTVEKGERLLWTLPFVGGSPRRLGEAFCDLARWSPDNRQIACVKGTSILLFNENGTNARTAGSFSSVPVRLLWSPSGDKLRVVLWDVNSGTETPWELSVSHKEPATITATTLLPLGDNCCSGWMWTHDRKTFLYTKQDRQGRGALFERLEGGFAPQEAELPVMDVGELAPGKTDNQFYVLMGAAYQGQLFKFYAETNAFQTFLPGLWADCLSFSKDGKWMTYVNLTDKSLWRSRVDGSEAIRLTRPPMEAEFSAWSADNQHIAFMGKLPGKPWRIFLVNPDGSAMREAAQGDDNQGAPTWSPDGAALVYGNISCEPTHTCWIRRIDLSTKREEFLPGSSGFRTARWSPDGKYVLALEPQTHELVLFSLNTGLWKALANGIMGDNPNWSTDSQYIYVDTVKEKTSVIERISVRDGSRNTVVQLASLQKNPGQLDYWIGLTLDNSPILLHQFTAVDIYAFDWTRD